MRRDEGIGLIFDYDEASMPCLGGHILGGGEGIEYGDGDGDLESNLELVNSWSMHLLSFIIYHFIILSFYHNK